MAGRLNFRIMRGKGLMVYAGPGIDRDLLKVTGEKAKPAWVGRAQAGVLLCPARMSAADDAAAPDAPPPGPEASKSLDFGLEGGYRFGPTAFSGFDARVYLLLTF
jgi:hypothetical protein